jgi:hypothetical protein
VVLDIASDQPESVFYEGDGLICGQDFQSGDIVSFTVVESASGLCTITTEIIPGG